MAEPFPSFMTRSAAYLRRDLIIAAAVGLSAAVVLSLQILTLSQDEVSQFSKYPNAAIQYLNNTIAPERLPDYSPLYLRLHIAAHSLLQEPLRWLHLVHIGLLSMTAGLLYLILRRYTGIIISLAGAGAFVLGKSVIIYGYLLEPEPLMIFFLTATLYFAEQRDRAGTIAAGISMALCLLTRPTFTPMVLIIPVYYWLHKRDWPQFLRLSLLFLAPALLVLIVISGRSSSVRQGSPLHVMSPGTVFFDGNSPLSTGTRAAYPPLVKDVAGRFSGESDYEHAAYRLFARKAEGRDLTAGEANQYWASKAFTYISDHPLGFLKVTTERLFYLFHSYRWHDLDPAWLTDQALGRRSLLFIPFGLLSALALIGLITGFGSWRHYLLQYMIFLNQAGFMALIYATDRQRVTLYPFFIFFAAVALAKIKQGWLNRKIAICLLLMLTALFSYNYDLMKDDRHTWEGTIRSETLKAEAVEDLGRLDYTGALKKSAEASALWPRGIEQVRLADLPVGHGELAEQALRQLPSLRQKSPSAELDTALLMIQAGRLDEAEAILLSIEREGRSFLRDADSLPDPLYHLGRIAFLRGRHDLSADFMRRALDKHPGDPILLSHLACLTEDSKQTDRVFKYFDDIDALFFLGRACLETGNPERAFTYLGRLSSLLPDNPRVSVYRAAALSASGRYREAAALYLATAGEQPGMVILDEHILSSFRQWAGEGTAESLYWYGIVLRQYGHFPEALQTLKQAAALGSDKAREELSRLYSLPMITP